MLIKNSFKDTKKWKKKHLFLNVNKYILADLAQIITLELRNVARAVHLGQQFNKVWGISVMGFLS